MFLIHDDSLHELITDSLNIKNHIETLLHLHHKVFMGASEVLRSHFTFFHLQFFFNLFSFSSFFFKMSDLRDELDTLSRQLEALARDFLQKQCVSMHEFVQSNRNVQNTIDSQARLLAELQVNLFQLCSPKDRCQVSRKQSWTLRHFLFLYNRNSFSYTS